MIILIKNSFPHHQIHHLFHTLIRREDIYENLESKLSHYKISGVPVVFDQKKRDEMIRKLSAFYQEMTEGEAKVSLTADRTEQPAE